ncbi:uncharacterized protein ARMOST_08820 [Armillaria ostoyae]|uniref:F-box domain-containing protein n=1 Tax=Armillaria ostoyae TaxID=47428 RepID=A0A284R9P1_ARMOS|nr:uncharacterized protein ARMOST_08820 [Armillaria ostoyae]
MAQKGKKQEAVVNRPKAPRSKLSRGERRRVVTGSTAVSRINELLPNELLAYIFSTVIITLLPKEHKSFLALVCSICRRWRDVAIEASELWTTIYVHHQKHIPAAELFLKRSKTQLLDVDIEVTFGRSFNEFRSRRDFGRQSGLRVAELLSAHLGRMRTLSLSVSDTLDAENAENFSTLYWLMSAPHLVSLSVNVRRWSPSAPPFLNSICSFHSNGNDGSSSSVALGSSLTRLELTSLTSAHLEHEDMRNIFMYSPFLETLILPKFGQCRGGDQEENWPIIFASSSLRSLAVHLEYTHAEDDEFWNSAESPCPCVLGSVRFPNLEYLEVLGDNCSCNLILSSHFKDLSGLKTLRLQRCSVPPLDDEFLRSLKLLNRLELADNLNVVKWSPKSSCTKMSLPFPHLSSISLSDESSWDYDLTPWARLARLAVQDHGCTQFSIEVSAHLYGSMSQLFGPQDEQIHIEARDHPPGLLYPLPPQKSFHWTYYYYDSDDDFGWDYDD